MRGVFLLSSVFWLAFGYLNNGSGNGGLSNLNGNNSLGNANWNILARISEIIRFSFLHAICAAAKIKREYTGRVGEEPITRSFSERVIPLHRLCKDLDITDVNTVLPWVEDCIKRHRKRHDFRDLLIAHGMTRTKYYELIRMIDAKNLGVPKEAQPAFSLAFAEMMDLYHAAVRRIAETACEYIATRNPKLRRVYIKERVDKTTGKIRMIGSESAMQQVLDYIAVYAAMLIFNRRILPQQVSSIAGRGQAQGVGMIKRWVRKDDAAARYAKRHKKRYARKCKFFVKLDIKKCFNSARKSIFMALFRRDCGNSDLIWLWDYLLTSHQVDGYEGFMIGALPSQWGAQYLISFACRFVKDLHAERRGKKTQLVHKIITFMDDITLFSSSRKHLKKAVDLLSGYMKETLGFTLKAGWHIKELAKESVDMMGYVIHQNGKVTIRGRDFIKARRMAIRRLTGSTFTRGQAARTTSYKGFFKNTDSRRAILKYSLREIFAYSAEIVSAATRAENRRKKGELSNVYKQCAV